MRGGLPRPPQVPRLKVRGDKLIRVRAGRRAVASIQPPGRAAPLRLRYSNRATEFDPNRSRRDCGLLTALPRCPSCISTAPALWFKIFSEAWNDRPRAGLCAGDIY